MLPELRDPKIPLQSEWLPLRGRWLVALLVGTMLSPPAIVFASWLWMICTGGFCR